VDSSVVCTPQTRGVIFWHGNPNLVWAYSQNKFAYVPYVKNFARDPAFERFEKSETLKKKKKKR